MKIKDLNKEKIYLAHLSGIWAVQKYFTSFFKHGYKLDINEQCLIDLASYYSQHIGMGIDKNVSKRPFLSIPSQMYSALSLMQVQKISIVKDINRIYVCLANIEGDKLKWPDLPSFAIGFYYENEAKIEFLKDSSKIDIKEHFFEENNLVVSKHTKLEKINLEFLETLPEDISQFIDFKAEFDFKEILENQLGQTIDKYDTGLEPQFQGTVYQTSAHKDIEQSWNAKYKEIERVKQEKEQELKSLKKNK